MIANFLVLCLIYTTVRSEAVDDVDAIGIKINAFGDKAHPFPEDVEKLVENCKKYITTMADPEVMFMYGGAFASTKKNRELALKTLKELGTSNTCDLIKTLPENAIKMTKELNAKVDLLAPIRQNFINVLVEIAKPDSKITPAIGACYIKKWAKESTDVLSSPELKEQFIVLIKTFTGLATSIDAAPTCEWSTIPAAPPQKYNSIDILFLEAAKVIITKNV